MAAEKVEENAAESGAGEVHFTSGFWFSEDVTPDLVLKSKLNKISFDAQSKFQKVQIIETAPFGRTLVLDSKTQSAASDEAVYHENLVHPAMLLHGNPKSVYIGGGGEYATAREVLRHTSVERCVMVDIDEVVCKICAEHLPEWHGGCLEDERLEVHYDDAKAWLERNDEKFDVIVMDIADPIEAGPGIVLYTKEFYEFAVTKLNPGGVIVTQSGPGSIFNITECNSVINKTLASVFTHVLPYAADIPSFGSNWGYNVAFNDDCAFAKSAAAAEESPIEHLMGRKVKDIDAQLSAALSSDLKILDGIALKGSFGLPKGLRDQIAAETRLMTIANPVFMY